MDTRDWLMLAELLVLAFQGAWICRLTKKYRKTQGIIGRLEAKVAQHLILVRELRGLMADEDDLDQCLLDEIDGKAWERAREVEYEQNKARWDEDTWPDRIPWVPKKNPK